MAKLSINKFVVDEMLFGTCENPVVVSAIEDAGEYWLFEIDGVDVPKCDRVTAIVETQQNRAGQKFNKTRFEVSG